MFTAFGVNVSKLGNLITLDVRIQHDETKKVVKTTRYTGVNTEDLRRQVQRDLEDLAGENLATLRANLVDQIVGQV